MINAFKSANPSWSKVGVVITDKDFIERAVFNEEFLEASLHICLFHTLRSFRREVTCDKLGIRHAAWLYSSKLSSYIANVHVLLN